MIENKSFTDVLFLRALRKSRNVNVLPVCQRLLYCLTWTVCLSYADRLLKCRCNGLLACRLRLGESPVMFLTAHRTETL